MGTSNSTLSYASYGWALRMSHLMPDPLNITPLLKKWTFRFQSQLCVVSDINRPHLISHRIPYSFPSPFFYYIQHNMGLPYTFSFSIHFYITNSRSYVMMILHNTTETYIIFVTWIHSWGHLQLRWLQCQLFEPSRYDSQLEGHLLHQDADQTFQRIHRCHPSVQLANPL